MGTCRQRRARSRTIDFFAVSPELRDLVITTRVVADGGFHPHSAVRLYIKRRPGAVMKRVLRKPPCLPRQGVPTCAVEHESGLFSGHAAERALDSQQSLDAGYASWVCDLEEMFSVGGEMWI